MIGGKGQTALESVECNFYRVGSFARFDSLYQNESMAHKAIIAVDDLTGAVAEWRSLDKDALLEVGDNWNDLETKVQAVLGAWLFVYDDVLGYGAIKELADRWDRKPQTLMNWKSVYKKTRNLPPAVDSLQFSKRSELARIPEQHQDDWIESATTMKRADLRKAIADAKKTGDWTPPAGDITVLIPETESPEAFLQNELSESEIKSSDIFSFNIGRLGISVRWERAARD